MLTWLFRRHRPAAGVEHHRTGGRASGVPRAAAFRRGVGERCCASLCGARMRCVEVCIVQRGGESACVRWALTVVGFYVLYCYNSLDPESHLLSRKKDT